MKIKYSKSLVSLFVFVSIYLISIIILASVSYSTGTSERPDSIYDPLFGIEYRPSEIHFDSAPNAIYKCKDLKKPRRELFLLGKATRGKVQFYYVYGLVEVDWGGSTKGVRRFEAESDSGIIVVNSPDGCRNIGAGYAWSPNRRNRQEAEKYGITDEVVTELLNDVVDREVKAFGGPKKFLSRLKAAGIDESKLPLQVREKLAAIRNKIREY